MPDSECRSRHAGLSNARQLVITLSLTFFVGGPLMFWLLGKENSHEQKVQAEQFLKTQAEVAARHSSHEKATRELARRIPAMTQPIPRASASTSPSSP